MTRTERIERAMVWLEEAAACILAPVPDMIRACLSMACHHASWCEPRNAPLLNLISAVGARVNPEKEGH